MIGGMTCKLSKGIRFNCYRFHLYAVSGGQVVRIDITNLGTVSSVLVGKVVAPIIAQDTNFVTILLPPLGDGIHQIYLNVPGKGYLVTDR